MVLLLAMLATAICAGYGQLVLCAQLNFFENISSTKLGTWFISASCYLAGQHSSSTTVTCTLYHHLFEVTTFQQSFTAIYQQKHSQVLSLQALGKGFI